jgi:hypothetical protein
VEHLNQLKRGAAEIQKQIVELVIYSEGAFSWHECWLLSSSERELIIKTLNNYNLLKSGKQPTEYL